MLALRTTDGINFADFEKRFNANFRQKYADKIKISEKYLDITDSSLAIKPGYLFVQNDIIINFMD